MPRPIEIKYTVSFFFEGKRDDPVMGEVNIPSEGALEKSFEDDYLKEEMCGREILAVEVKRVKES